MHISIIANAFQEDYIVDLLNNLKDKVDKIDFIGSSIYADRKIDPKIKFYDLRGKHDENESRVDKSLRILIYYYHLVIYLYKTKAKIIHIQWLRFHIIEGILLTIYMRAIGKKVVYTVHDILPRSKDNTYNRLVFKIIYKLQNQLIVHTSYIKKKIATEFNINPSKIHVVTHGIYHRVENTAITQQKAREYLKLSQSSTVLLFFGIIDEYKGFDLLLDSLSTLNNLNDFQVLVAGKVKLAYKNKFDEIVKANKSGNIVYLLRYIKDEEIEYCFKASNITVLPYKEASQSGVMLMSYAYGVPVIGPLLGGFPEDIMPGKTGYLFEPDDFKSLAGALIEFKTGWPATEKNMRINIKNIVSSKYSWDNSCDEIVKLYEKLDE